MGRKRKATRYPECDKLAAVRKDSQNIGEFIDWLRGEKNMVISEWVADEDADEGERLNPVNISVEHLLALYFSIDLKKVEAERREIIADLNKPKKKVA